MKNKKILYIVVITALTIPSIAAAYYFYKKSKTYILSPEDKEMVFETANNFSECAAYFDAISWVAEKAGLAEASAGFKNAYRGWYMAGAYILFSTGAVEEWPNAVNYTESMSNGASQNYRARYEVDFEAAKIEMDALYEQKCTPAAEYQKSLIMEMRRTIASYSEKKE